MNQRRQRILWLEQDRQRERHFKRTYRLIKAALNAQFAPAYEAVRNGLPSDATNRVNFLPVQMAFLQLYAKVGADFAKSAYRSLKPLVQKDDREEQLLPTWEALMRQQVLSQGAQRIKGITDTTREVIQKVIEEAIEEGLSIENTAARLKQRWREVTERRAVIISRTEILSASNYGAIMGAKTMAQETGLQLEKVWLSTADKRTRDTHRAVSEQRRDLDVPFSVNGYRMMHPGDSSLGAPGEEVILCRCAVVFEPK